MTMDLKKKQKQNMFPISIVIKSMKDRLSTQEVWLMTEDAQDCQSPQRQHPADLTRKKSYKKV